VELIPAIDLLGGEVVRLHKGDYDASTAYSRDPVATAIGFAEAGARRLHVVDLEGARGGDTDHREVIAQIVERAPLEVQVGGGIRSRSIADGWLEAGASRVVLGTVAVREPDVAAGLCADHPGRVVIAIDARGEAVSVEGWQQDAGQTVRDLALRADGWGAAAILYTDIDRDGTGQGPAVSRTASLQGDVRATVIASGGIGSLDHLVALRDAGVRAAVCGRALYEGAFELADALALLAPEGA